MPKLLVTYGRSTQPVDITAYPQHIFRTSHYLWRGRKHYWGSHLPRHSHGSLRMSIHQPRGSTNHSTLQEKKHLSIKKFYQILAWTRPSKNKRDTLQSSPMNQIIRFTTQLTWSKASNGIVEGDTWRVLKWRLWTHHLWNTSNRTTSWSSRSSVWSWPCLRGGSNTRCP